VAQVLAKGGKTGDGSIWSEDAAAPVESMVEKVALGKASREVKKQGT